LILAETFARRLTAFEIAADGNLANRRVGAPLGGRIPDGICLDGEGAIWVAHAGGPECVRVAEGGEVLDRVATSQPCYACMLGGVDGRTLFMMTAPPLGAGADDGEGPLGRIEIAAVDVAHAGRP
jgi:sugar lactone lactonase YvrE